MPLCSTISIAEREKKEQKKKPKMKAAIMLEPTLNVRFIMYIVNFEHLAHWTKSPGHLSKFKRKKEKMIQCNSIDCFQIATECFLKLNKFTRPQNLRKVMQKEKYWANESKENCVHAKCCR